MAFERQQEGRVMHRAATALVAGVFIGGIAAYSQSKGTEVSTAVTKAQVEAVLKHPEGGGDRQIKVVDVGKLNVGVGVLHRGAVKDAGGPVRGLSHTLVTEVYYITSGSGTLVTGGALTEQKPMPADAEVVKVAVGPSITSASQNGQTRVVSAGDIVVIPAGMFHGWKEVPDHVTYVSIRPDPDRVLPVGYVNPAIK
jgi:mannose-6-phosphate isomerase-like protein (cupin superfamily)